MVQWWLNSRRVLLWFALGFIVVVLGVTTGAYITSRFVLHLPDSPNPAVVLSREIKVGHEFPDIRVRNQVGEQISLELGLGPDDRVVASLSGDCGACAQILTNLEASPQISPGKLELIVLSPDSKMLSLSAQATCYEISQEELHRLDIRLFPTLVLINTKGIVVGVSGNLSQAKLIEFLSAG